MGVDLLQSRNRAVEDGNARMQAGKAEEALSDYDKALGKLPAEPGVHFDRGAALYNLSRFDEAAQAFLRATESKNPTLKASAFYNLGNSFFQTKKYGEAVEAFKKSLTYNPADVHAKWNLELALKMKRDEDKKNQDNKDKNDKDKKSDKDKKDDKQGQNDKQDKKDDQAKQDEKQKQDDKQKQDEKPQQEQQAKQDEKQKQDEKKDSSKPEPQPSAADKKNEAPADLREIDGILDSLERSPKALEQERARLRAVRRQPPAKDW